MPSHSQRWARTGNSIQLCLFIVDFNIIILTSGILQMHKIYERVHPQTWMNKLPGSKVLNLTSANQWHGHVSPSPFDFPCPYLAHFSSVLLSPSQLYPHSKGFYGTQNRIMCEWPTRLLLHCDTATDDVVPSLYNRTSESIQSKSNKLISPCTTRMTPLLLLGNK